MRRILAGGYLVLAAAACAPATEPPTTPPAVHPAMSGDQQTLSALFVECMAGHGVDVWEVAVDFDRDFGVITDLEYKRDPDLVGYQAVAERCLDDLTAAAQEFLEP